MMRSVRRWVGVAVLLGAGVGIVGAAPSASAYCANEIFTDGSGGGNGCSNPCPPPPTLLQKLGFGWECLE